MAGAHGRLWSSHLAFSADPRPAASRPIRDEACLAATRPGKSGTVSWLSPAPTARGPGTSPHDLSIVLYPRHESTRVNARQRQGVDCVDPEQGEHRAAVRDKCPSSTWLVSFRAPSAETRHPRAETRDRHPCTSPLAPRIPRAPSPPDVRRRTAIESRGKTHGTTGADGGAGSHKADQGAGCTGLGPASASRTRCRVYPPRRGMISMNR